MNVFTIEELEQIQTFVASNKQLYHKIANMISEAKSNEEVLYKFHWDCNRMGKIEGIFKAKESFVEDLIGNEVYFGEVLGKHSEVYGILEEKDLEIISRNPLVVMNAIESGYNPLKHIRIVCDICEEAHEMMYFENLPREVCTYCETEKENVDFYYNLLYNKLSKKDK